jgi:hypothetical protein
MSTLKETDAEVLAVIRGEADQLRTELSFSQAVALPESASREVVIAGKKVQLTIFRQTELPFLKGDVLVTVQVAYSILGGFVSHHTERGIVFSPNEMPREATHIELRISGG